MSSCYWTALRKNTRSPLQSRETPLSPPGCMQVLFSNEQAHSALAPLPSTCHMLEAALPQPECEHFSQLHQPKESAKTLHTRAEPENKALQRNPWRGVADFPLEASQSNRQTLKARVSGPKSHHLQPDQAGEAIKPARHAPSATWPAVNARIWLPENQHLQLNKLGEAARPPLNANPSCLIQGITLSEPGYQHLRSAHQAEAANFSRGATLFNGQMLAALIPRPECQHFQLYQPNELAKTAFALGFLTYHLLKCRKSNQEYQNLQLNEVRKAANPPWGAAPPVCTMQAAIAPNASSGVGAMGMRLSQTKEVAMIPPIRFPFPYQLQDAPAFQTDRSAQQLQQPEGAGRIPRQPLSTPKGTLSLIKRKDDSRGTKLSL